MRAELIARIVSKMGVYQGMEDDIEGLNNLDITELEKLAKEEI